MIRQKIGWRGDYEMNTLTFFLSLKQGEEKKGMCRSLRTERTVKIKLLPNLYYLLHDVSVNPEKIDTGFQCAMRNSSSCYIIDLI